MHARSPLGFIVVAAALALAGILGWASQWHQGTLLRTELEMARLQADELGRLRAENRRLREQQISAAELAALRADHAALPRLRGELEALGRNGP